MCCPAANPGTHDLAAPETDADQRPRPTRPGLAASQTHALMQVHVNANNSVHNHESLERWAREELNASLRRFGNDITNVEMHLSDENSERISPEHKRCMLEARLANHPPVAVSHQAGSLDEAIRGAIDKLRRALDHTFGKLRDQRDRTSIRRAGQAPEDASPTAESDPAEG